MESTIGVGYRHGAVAGEDAENAQLPGAASSIRVFVQGQTLSATVMTMQQQQPQDDDDGGGLVDLAHDGGGAAAAVTQDAATVQEGRHAARQGRLRAQAILRRFEQQRESLLRQLPVTAAAIHSSSHERGDASSPSPSSSSVYVEQRRKAALVQRRRFQDAWIKNFAYVEQKQQASARHLQDQIAAAKQREAEADNQYRRILEERQRQKKKQALQLQQQSAAGIGTQKRRRVEATKAQQNQAATTMQPFTAALYITGIPRDFSVTTNTIRDIFRAYGSLTKVHFYRDKTTGDLKGDGLVVYQVETQPEKEELIHTVCTQVGDKTRRPCC